MEVYALSLSLPFDIVFRKFFVRLHNSPSMQLCIAYENVVLSVYAIWILHMESFKT